VVDHPEAGGVRTLYRRRRTSRHRRNRQIRRVLLVVFVVAVAFGSRVALHYLRPTFSRASQSASRDQVFENSRDVLLQSQQEILRQMGDRPVYPYSVVPGGVRDVAELKWAADHDPVVRAHYAGFDYDHARVVRLVLERTAYISYRIGNKVYWTRRRIKLKKGETVITDGKITARTRCANRVEEAPPQVASSSEPPIIAFDEPVQPVLGPAAQNPPQPFQSTLNRPGLGPAPPLSVLNPFGWGVWVPIAPPPLPGVCGVGKKTTVKKKGSPCAPGGGGGGEVPEPGTWLLVAGGLGVMFCLGHCRFARS
jgi:hypothetical protein